MTYALIIRRRLQSLCFVFFGVTFLTFVIANLVPTDVARMVAGNQASQETVDQVRRDLGLDKPVLHRYVLYIGRLVQGDLGTSIRTGNPVLSDLTTFLPATLELALFGLTLSVLIAIPLGVAAAVYRGRMPDHLIRLVGVSGISMPAFWLALLLLYVFYGTLDVLPAGGRMDAALAATIPAVTGLMTVDTLIAGDAAAFWSALRHLLLPGATLAIITMGGGMRLIRASMIEALEADYIVTARANGLSEFRILFGHALPNALIPFVTALALTLGDLLAGSVVIEAIFGWPGMGSYILSAALSLDFPAIMGFTVLVASIYVLANLLVDLSYMVLNPRVRQME